MNPPNTNLTLSSDAVACVGLDWGDKAHAWALSDLASGRRETGTFQHSAENLHAWLDKLALRFGGRPVVLAIEGTRGAIFPALLDRPWLQVYAVHPTTSSRYRNAFTPSGAKDDIPDAEVLLELVERHRDKLAQLSLTDADTRRLAWLCEARRDLVDRRTQLVNQFIACLKSFYPQAFELVGDDLASPMALDFLDRWPDLLELKRARPATLRRFYYTHNVRRPETVQARIELVAGARALTTDEVVVEIGVRKLRVLIEQLRVAQRHIAEYDKTIAEAFKAHPDSLIFREVPGAGPVLAPRLLAAFGADRSCYPDPESLQKYSGLAPVREKSGGALWTHWRWNAPRFVRQSFVEWAGQSVLHCAWAQAYYQQMKAKEKGHWAILRALAFKWVRVLWVCWQKRVPYDDARYVQGLQRRKSPLASALAASPL